MNKSEITGSLKNVKKVDDKLTSFLHRKHITKIHKLAIEKVQNGYDEYRVTIREVPESIGKERQLDGRYFIQSEVSEEVDPEEIRGRHKSLQKVERAFDIAKHVLDIRPMYVRRATRILGHIMIIYLSLLVETLFEKKPRELYP